MSKSTKGRVLVAMSGGVDSSVAAALLVRDGYEVIGATMQVWDYSNCDLEEGHGTCCSNQDVDDARAVADHLNIPFYVLNCEEKFHSKVIQPFIDDYLKGSTPLPCVNCNTFLKFDHLINKMKELDCDYLATGHYAQIQVADGKSKIITSEDSWKDQTYFLFTLESSILPNLLFPVGSYEKTQIRAIAKEMGIPTAAKKDSTGICFVGSGGYSEFIQNHLKQNNIKENIGLIKRYPSGEVLGKHNGISGFTYGQGKGLGLNHHEKLFVVKIDPKTSDVWVGDEKYLFQSHAEAVDLHYLDEIESGEELNVKIRYSHKAAKARVEKTDKGIKLHFIEPQRAVTPGQAAVLYRDKHLLGGGWIL